MEFYWKILGIGPWGVWTMTESALKDFTIRGRQITDPFEYKVAVAMLGNIQFELIEPGNAPGTYREFLKRKGEGFHHIKEYIKKEDLPEVLDNYHKKGIEVLQSGKFDEDTFYVLDTEPTLGIIYEISNCGNARPYERIYPNV